jgi:hypothetical protein
MIWGFSWLLWELWLALLLALVLVGLAVATWGRDGRRPPPPLDRRPLPRPKGAPRPVPRHAAWTREDGTLGGDTRPLHWVARDQARASVLRQPPFIPADQGDEDRWGPWPGDRR